MFRNLSSTLANAKKTEEAKAMSPTLRSDIYSSIDQAKAGIVGGAGSGQAGDGVWFGPIVPTIQKHFPETKIGLESIAQAEGETAVIVGAITNMILTMSKWEGMASGMAMRTWVDVLASAHAAEVVQERKDMIARGITRGINQNTDVTLMTREFATRIQIISLLKTGMWSFFRIVPNKRANNLFYSQYQDIWRLK